MATLGSRLVGTWRLVSREDRTPDGELRVDPGLGSDPVALLVYDAAGNFAAQFMKRGRTTTTLRTSTGAGENNSVAIGGYDAYFGTYTVDEGTGSVTQRLLGALSPTDIDKVVTREMHVDDDRLTIHLATRGVEGEPITRTLIWERLA